MTTLPMTPAPFSLAVIQCPLGSARDENVARVVAHIRDAAARGANVILPPELFETPYFPQHEREDHFALARPRSGHPLLAELSALARELEVVIPVSFFERAGQAFYNSVVVIDADGSERGLYRKAHIPDGPGYEEKYYFRPGDTGFQVFATRYAKLGVGICWDQWFPECARAMTLLGADLLLYPTAIGSEPEEPDLDTRDPWRRVMIGHAVANAIPVAAANRIGVEDAITFYGTSFIADHRGDLLADQKGEEGVALATIDPGASATYRAGFGFFRDRRPGLYGALLTADGSRPVLKLDRAELDRAELDRALQPPENNS